jgi:hypothetical protein
LASFATSGTAFLAPAGVQCRRIGADRAIVYAGAQDKEDAGQHRAVIDRWATALRTPRLSQEQRRKKQPKSIRNQSGGQPAETRLQLLGFATGTLT